MNIAPGLKVTLHFSLKLDDDSIVDSTFDGKPATFVIGDGNLLVGFEKKLIGLGIGAKESFLITPEQGFGQPNPNNIQQVATNVFDSNMELSEGLVVSFADAAGAETPGVITEFDDKFATVDFNHPLSGRDITFDVEIIDVKPGAIH